MGITPSRAVLWLAAAAALQRNHMGKRQVCIYTHACLCTHICSLECSSCKEEVDERHTACVPAMRL